MKKLNRTEEQKKEASRIASQKNRDKVKDTGMTELRGVFVKTEGYYRTKEKVINFLKKTYKNK